MGPERTCIGCRKAGEKDELIRWVLTPSGHIQVDLKGRLPGRGVYLCPRLICFERALKGQRFVKTFRKSISTPSLDELVAQVCGECRRKIKALAGLANRAREVISGRVGLIEALRKGQVQLLLIAEDAAENSQRELIHQCEKRGVHYHLLFTREELGSIVGKDLRSALGLLGANFIPAIERYAKIKDDLEAVPVEGAGQKGGR